jgi:hypothetical protein
VRDREKVTKRRLLVSKAELGLEQAYAVETFLLTPEANRVFIEMQDRQFVPESKLGPIENRYSPVLSPERREFLDIFWIKDTPYYMFDIKLRELLEVYYQWLLTGV